jgi:hypothetical protein
MQTDNEMQIDDQGAETEAAPPIRSDGAAVPPNVPAAADARLVNPFTLFRQRSSGGGGFFRGDLIKCDYRSGEWTREHGEKKTLIDADERFIVNPHEMIDTWTKRVDGKVIEREVYRVIDGEFAPERDALGDLDERRWPWDRSGKRRKDPWERAVYLPMKGNDGEVVAFRATGQGAIAEIAELVGMYGNADRHGKFPVVKPDSRSFESQHGSTIYVPVFRLVDWQFWEADTPAPPVSPVAVPIAAPTQSKPAPRQLPKHGEDSDMDDEIPF